MPAESKAQQKFMGMVHATQKGDIKAPSKKVEEAANEMSTSSAKDFAETKRKGLPEHVKESMIKGFAKRAAQYGLDEAAIKQAAEGYRNVALQNYMPIEKKHKFSPEEEQGIEEGQSQIFPKIFRSNKDPIPVDMSSPMAGALLYGAPAALAGGLGGAALGGKDSSVPALLGALLAGGAGGLYGYKHRQAGNETLEDTMSRLPRGATRRDMLADPVYQAERERGLATERNALLAAALARR